MGFYFIWHCRGDQPRQSFSNATGYAALSKSVAILCSIQQSTSLLNLFIESEPASPFDWWVQHLGSNSNQCVNSPKSFSYSDNSCFVNILVDSNIQSLTTVNKLCKTAFSGVKVAALSLDYHSSELHDCSTSYTCADSDSKAIHLPFV